MTGTGGRRMITRDSNYKRYLALFMSLTSSLAFLFAPWASNTSTTSVLPHLAAECRGVPASIEYLACNIDRARNWNGGKH